MENQNNASELHQRIAADLLIALIEQGRLKPGGVSGREDVIIADTLKEYQTLLAGISAASIRA